MPKFLAWLLKPISKDVQMVYKVWGVRWGVDNSRSKELGVEYRPVEESLYDMVESLIKQGYIPEKRAT